MSATSLLRLCDHAEAFHVAARSTLARLDGRVRAGPPHPGLIAPWNELNRQVLAHFAEEEELLFPALRDLANGTVPTYEGFSEHLAGMANEFEETQQMSAELRAVARHLGRLGEDIVDLLDDLEHHAQREQRELLPAAWRLLSTDGRTAG